WRALHGAKDSTNCSSTNQVLVPIRAKVPVCLRLITRRVFPVLLSTAPVKPEHHEQGTLRVLHATRNQSGAGGGRSTRRSILRAGKRIHVSRINLQRPRHARASRHAVSIR